MKSTQITLRIDKDLKDNIEELANKQNLSISEWIRSTLTQEVDLQKNSSHLDNEIANFNENQAIFFKSGMHVIGLDTQLPINEVISKTTTFFQNSIKGKPPLTTLKRNEREVLGKNGLVNVIEELDCTDLARLCLYSNYLVYLGLVTNSEIYPPYGLSMEFNELYSRLRYQMKTNNDLNKVTLEQ